MDLQFLVCTRRSESQDFHCTTAVTGHTPVRVSWLLPPPWPLRPELTASPKTPLPCSAALIPVVSGHTPLSCHSPSFYNLVDERHELNSLGALFSRGIDGTLVLGTKG
jgi:hypothetical protein